ncbi:MAG: hypothetical protein Q8Q49_04915 [bacterium]|nr:hypothetical protein [bacterium]
MSTKTLVWLGVIIGSVMGQFVPTLFGISFLSAWAIVGSGIGGILGIIIGIKIGNRIN